MKWTQTAYIRVAHQGDFYFVHLVTERLLRKEIFLLLQTQDQNEARTFALSETAQRQISCRFEDS